MLREMNQPLTAYATFYEEDGEEGETGEHPVVNVYRNNVQIVANDPASELGHGRYYYTLPAAQNNTPGDYQFHFYVDNDVEKEDLWVGVFVVDTQDISSDVVDGIINNTPTIKAEQLVPFTGTVINDGTQSGGTSANINVKDGVTWDIDSAAGLIDVEINFDLTNLFLNELRLTVGLVAHRNDFCDILAWNGSSWDTVSTQGSRVNPNLGLLNILIPLGSAYVDNDLFRIRIAGSMREASTLSIDYAVALAATTGDYVLTASEVAEATAQKMVAAIYPRISLDTVDGDDPATPTIGETGTSLYPAKTVTYAVNSLVKPLGYVNIRVSKQSDITLTEDLIDQALFNDHAFPGSFWKLQLAGFDISDSFFLGAEVSGAYTFTNAASLRNCRILNVSGPGLSVAQCVLAGRMTVTSGNALLDRCSSSAIVGSAIVTLQDATSHIYVLALEGALTIEGMAAGNVVQISGGGGVLVIDATCTGGELTVDGNWQITDNSGNVTIYDDSNYDRLVHIPEQTADIGALTALDVENAVWNADHRNHTGDNTYGLFLDIPISTRASQLSVDDIDTIVTSTGVVLTTEQVDALIKGVLTTGTETNTIEDDAQNLSIAMFIHSLLRAEIDGQTNELIINKADGTEWVRVPILTYDDADPIIAIGP